MSNSIDLLSLKSYKNLLNRRQHDETSKYLLFYIGNNTCFIGL